MRFNALTVGELAEQTGLSVRTLHYYDEIDILNPSQHTEGGYRVYTPGDLERLHHVLMLRQLGFSLAEVRQQLDAPEFLLSELIRLYIAHLRKRIKLQEEVCECLETMFANLRTAGEISQGEFLRMIEAMISIENDRTSEQS
jgi:MerR family transcriptional regulator, thiopeptide resistance regulator